MRKPFLLLLASLTSLAITQVAQSKVVESRDGIVGTREHRSLTTEAEYLGTPDTPMPAGVATTQVGITGCNLTVMVVGPIKGDARAYAAKLDQWRGSQGMPGDVEFSQEDDSADVYYKYSAGGFGKSSASIKVDLPSLRKCLLSMEPKATVVVTDAAYAKLDLGRPPSYTNRSGLDYWNITQYEPPVVTGSLSTPPWLVPVLVLWAGLVPVGTLIAFALAIKVAKNESIPLKTRRLRYRNTVMRGVFGVIMCHAVLFSITIALRVFDPLSQLWFGERFAMFGMILVMPFCLVPLAALPFMNKHEKKLMGPAEDEAQKAAPPILREVTNKPTHTWAWILIPIAIGFAFLMVGVILPWKIYPFARFAAPCGMFVMVISSFVRMALAKKPKYAATTEELNQFTAKLDDSVTRMARNMGESVPKFTVATATTHSRYAGTASVNGSISFSLQAVEELTNPELDFVVARALACKKLKQPLATGLLTFGPVFLVAPLTFAFTFSLRNADPTGRIISFALIPIVFIPSLLLARPLMQRLQLACDLEAVRATRDPQTAVETIHKIARANLPPGWLDANPRILKDIDARTQAIRLQYGLS